MNEKIELISIHIPKCGGTNFRDILQMHYRNVPHLNDLKTQDQCMHGHFIITPELLQEYPNAKICTWIRHPIDRIISYYYSWKLNKSYGKNFNKKRFIEEDMSIVEFVEADFMQNEMFKYIDQISLDDFDFIGCLEKYPQDIVKFLEIMGWNTTNEKKSLGDTIYNLRSARRIFGTKDGDISIPIVINRKNNVNRKKRIEEITEKEYKRLYKVLECDIDKYNYIRVNYCGHDTDTRYKQYKTKVSLSMFSRIKAIFCRS